MTDLRAAATAHPVAVTVEGDGMVLTCPCGFARRLGETRTPADIFTAAIEHQLQAPAPAPDDASSEGPS